MSSRSWTRQGLDAFDRARLGTDVISATQTIRSWVKAGLMDDYDGIALRDAGIEELEDEISFQIEGGMA